MLTETEIQTRLNQVYSPTRLPESPYPAGFHDTQPNPAAVLITFLMVEDDWHLLFIKRTTIPEDKHSGQVAFPGGRCESADQTAEEAALREAQEEVGINPKDVTILGRLGETLTITNYCVTPIVGVIPWPYKFVAKTDEVDRIFSIPLSWLADQRNRVVKMRGMEIIGRNVPVIYFNRFNGELLWGASARITVLLLEALGLAAPEDRYN